MFTIVIRNRYGGWAAESNDPINSTQQEADLVGEQLCIAMDNCRPEHAPHTAEVMWEVV
jgi:hypothetical protein